MEERYRSDYEGEFVITGVKYVNGRKQQEREFVDTQLKLNQFLVVLLVLVTVFRRLKLS